MKDLVKQLEHNKIFFSDIEKAQAPGQNHGLPGFQSHSCVQSHLQNYKATTRSH